MNDQLEIYKQVILEHNKKPRNFGVLLNFDSQAEGYNPICGDHLFVSLKLSDKGEIEDVKFEGSGCAISKASASMMTVALKGQSVATSKEIVTDFLHLLKGELAEEEALTRIGKLKIFASIWKYPARVKCASLAWYTFKGALEKIQGPISTE